MFVFVAGEIRAANVQQEGGVLSKHMFPVIMARLFSGRDTGGELWRN